MTLESQRAAVLTQALPYIQKYTGQIVVVKYGGNAMVNESLKHDVMTDLVLLSLVGIRVVLVHGGGPEITEMLTRLSIPSRFENGLRVTDAATVEIVQMVLSGKTNKDLVALIGASGGKAVGLCGLDGRMIEATKLTGHGDLGYVGDITHINPEPILRALDGGYIPVIATLGVDEAGQTYNINADTAAAAIAGALSAQNLLTLTDIRGLMRDVKDPDSFIDRVCIDEIQGLIDQGIVSGGMIPKVESCREAVANGVGRATMIDGRIPHAILLELFSDEGIGTMFTK